MAKPIKASVKKSLSKMEAFVRIENNKVKADFTLYFKPDEDYVLGCIPAFDIYFSAKDKAELEARAGTMVRSFIRFWLNEQGIRPFFLQIHKLGFRAPNHDLMMKTILKDRLPVNTKFSSLYITAPDGFHKDSEVLQEAEVEI